MKKNKTSTKRVVQRFASIPCHCSNCDRLIWLKSYTKIEMIRFFSFFNGLYYQEKLCKECSDEMSEKFKSLI